ARQKFIQISLGAIYDEHHATHLIDAKPRLDELLEILEQAPGKTLIFVPLTSIVDLLYKELSRSKLAFRNQGRRSYAVVNGNVSVRERGRIFENFQSAPDTGPTDIIADPGTMSHGLDLWQAQTTIWYGITDKPELYAQANRRAHRPGQKYPVSVVQMVSNPLEREVFRRLENNLALQGALLDLVKQNAI